MCHIIELMSTTWPIEADPAGFAGGVPALIAAVNDLDGNTSDAHLIDRIAALEHLKSACAAAQARLTHTFTLSQTTDSAAGKVDADTVRRSIAGQIGLARRDSRHAGGRHLGWLLRWFVTCRAPWRR